MHLNIEYIKSLIGNEKLENGLYIVSTPIGNLSDITLRALRILSSSDIIICEDTRITRRLITKFAIKTPLESFHKFNSKKMIPKILGKLNKGRSVSLVSDSGTPAISDPGDDLIEQCTIKNIKVFSIPGPSAPIASLVLSSFNNGHFTFRGFFPRDKKGRESSILKIKESDCPIVYFETAKRIIKTFYFLKEKLGDCKIAFVRELTKKHEEVINAPISDILYILENKNKIRGEITFIIQTQKDQFKQNISQSEILEIAVNLKNEGLTISEISKKISNDLEISKRSIYQILIKNLKL